MPSERAGTLRGTPPQTHVLRGNALQQSLTKCEPIIRLSDFAPRSPPSTKKNV